MSHELVPLAYPYNVLEPEIEEKVMSLHHNYILKSFVDELNDLLVPFSEFQYWPLEDLILRNQDLPALIREGVWNSAGGVYNHNLFFHIMGKSEQNHNKDNTGTNNTRHHHIKQQCNHPSGLREIEKAIIDQFHSMEHFIDAFITMTGRVFGCGYTWLVTNGDGILSFINTSNQDTVLIYPVIPIFLIDLWEHAYYLQYFNKREEYVKNWIRIINWDTVNETYVNTNFSPMTTSSCILRSQKKLPKW